MEQTSVDLFAQRVSVQAAAHVCRAVGCQRAFPSVLDTLADVIKHFVETVGTHAHRIAEHGGRQDVTVVDALAAMKQMGPEPIDWRGLRNFAFNDQGSSWQQPFHVDVPRLPVRKRKRQLYAAERDDEAAEPHPPHIPPFLPELPPPHTLKRTKVPAVKRSNDARELREKRVKRNQDAQQVLFRITAKEDDAAAAAGPTSAGGASTTDPSTVLGSEEEAPVPAPAGPMLDAVSASTKAAEPTPPIAGMSRQDRILEGIQDAES